MRPGRNTSPRGALRCAAAAAVALLAGALTTSCATCCKEMVRSEIPAVRIEGLECFEEQKSREEAVQRHLEALKDRAPEVRMAALKYFARHPVEEQKIVPVVVERLHDVDEVRAQARETLKAYGPDCLSSLGQLWQEDNARALEIAEVVGQIGTAEGIKILDGMLDARNRHLVERALEQLQKVGPCPESVIRRVARLAAGGSSLGTRDCAQETLHDLVAKVPTSDQQVLVALLADDFEGTRQVVIRELQLRNLAPTVRAEARRSITPLALGTGTEKEQGAAAEMVEDLVRGGEYSGPELLRMADDARFPTDLRWAALNRIPDQAGREAVPTLEDVAGSDKNPERVRQAARDALRRLTPSLGAASRLALQELWEKISGQFAGSKRDCTLAVLKIVCANRKNQHVRLSQEIEAAVEGAVSEDDFILVSRDRLGAVIQEQRLRLAGRLSDSQMRKVGDVTAATAIIAGDFARREAVSDAYWTLHLEWVQVNGTIKKTATRNFWYEATDSDLDVVPFVVPPAGGE